MHVYTQYLDTDELYTGVMRIGAHCMGTWDIDNMGTWQHGGINSMETWGDMGVLIAWAHGDMGVLIAWAHGDMGVLIAWAHGQMGINNMGTWAHGY